MRSLAIFAIFLSAALASPAAEQLGALAECNVKGQECQQHDPWGGSSCCAGLSCKFRYGKETSVCCTQDAKGCE
ncbi:hypothetical protein N7540_013162 [Penicillium herquei]|nr:hypothetical protein N7540_013162 [Penicillium herquei]